MIVSYKDNYNWETVKSGSESPTNYRYCIFSIY